ncbi:MAG: ABC transporter ATP-binding protein, partial [Eggerthellaceae bacterium]|nr:ABC transporter ATP-binding protein [Eggerthellaceae bacterium]
GIVPRFSSARAFIGEPELVLMDEPYAGLDPKGTEVFDGIIEENRDGKTFVMVSHDIQKGMQMASHVLVLKHGRAMHFGEKGSLDVEDITELCNNGLSST